MGGEDQNGLCWQYAVVAGSLVVLVYSFSGYDDLHVLPYYLVSLFSLL